MRQWSVLVILGACVLGASACHNSCQQICSTMRKIVEDDCGLVVSDEDFDACLDGQKGKASSDDRKVCRQWGDAETIREEWTCEDLEDYFRGDTTEQ